MEGIALMNTLRFYWQHAALFILNAAHQVSNEHQLMHWMILQVLRRSWMSNPYGNSLMKLLP